MEDTIATQKSTETPDLAGDESFYHPLTMGDLAEAQGVEPFSADKVKDWFLSDKEMSDFLKDIDTDNGKDSTVPAMRDQSQ